MLLLRANPGSQELQAELIHACKVDLVYDGQIEQARAPYLYRLVRETGKVEIYYDELFRCLIGAEQEDNEIDVGQIFEILCLAAADDRKFDRAALRDFLLGADYEEVGNSCLCGFVGLEGIEGLLLCVRGFYSALLENFVEEGGWLFRSLVDSLVERDGAEIATAELQSARASCIELNLLMSANEVEGPAYVQDEELNLDYATLKASDLKSFPYAWVKAASAEELVQAADDLLAERDEQKIWRYLQLFRRRDFPRPPKSIFHFVRSSNRSIPALAARVLQRISDPDVRALALELLSEGILPTVAVRLLRSNFQRGDFKIVEELLERLTFDEHTWHNLGLAVLDVLDHADILPEESRGILLRLYENDPCSNCRQSIVAMLSASGSVPGWMAEECRFDAEPDTVSLFDGAH